MDRIRILTPQEIQDIPAFLSMDEIRQYGFVAQLANPIPDICPFCNKQLEFKGVRSLFKNMIIKWKDDPEPCTCRESQKTDTAKNEEEIVLSGILKLEISDTEGDTVLSIFEDHGKLYFDIGEPDKPGTEVSAMVDKDEFLRLFGRMLGFEFPDPRPESQAIKLW